jgi:hypothetical protein
LELVYGIIGKPGHVKKVKSIIAFRTQVLQLFCGEPQTFSWKKVDLNVIFTKNEAVE